MRTQAEIDAEAMSNEQRARAFLNDMFPETTVRELGKLLDEAEARWRSRVVELEVALDSIGAAVNVSAPLDEHTHGWVRQRIREALSGRTTRTPCGVCGRDLDLCDQECP